MNSKIELKDFEGNIEEYGEFFFNIDGIFNESTVSNKLSAIQKRVIEDELEVENIANNFSIELVNAISNSHFESGVQSEADNVFNTYHDKYGVLAVNWLVKLFISNLFDAKIVLGIVIIVSRHKLLDIGYQGQMILISATYKFKDDIQIQESIIRCIENWESYELINILDQLHPNQEWLVNYKDSVIEDLKQQCLNT